MKTYSIDVVHELRKRGIRMWLIASNIRMFPRSLLNDEVKQIVSENRKALIDELARMDAELPSPHFNNCGDLVIPYNSPKRYHWWAGGQPISQTLNELKGD